MVDVGVALKQETECKGVVWIGRATLILSLQIRVRNPDSLFFFAGLRSAVTRWYMLQMSRDRISARTVRSCMIKLPWPLASDIHGIPRAVPSKGPFTRTTLEERNQKVSNIEKSQSSGL
jgi:hypothetical protein